jgi:hypothetical protein
MSLSVYYSVSNFQKTISSSLCKYLYFRVCNGRLLIYLNLILTCFNVRYCEVTCGLENEIKVLCVVPCL